MARQVAVVYQDEPGRRVVRPKRQQAIGLAIVGNSTGTSNHNGMKPALAAAKKKPTRTRSKKANVRFAPSATSRPSISAGSKARGTSKKTAIKSTAASSSSSQRLLLAPQDLATHPSNQTQNRPQQQQREQALQPLPSNAVVNGPVLRKPIPSRKLSGGNKTQAAAKLKSSSSIQITATAVDSSGFTSSTTLVATSNANSSFIYQESREDIANLDRSTFVPKPPQDQGEASTEPSSHRLPRRLKALLPAVGKSHASSNGKENNTSPDKRFQRPSDQGVQPKQSKRASFESNAICKRLSSVLTSIDSETFQGDPDEDDFWHKNRVAISQPRGDRTDARNGLVDNANGFAHVLKQPTKRAGFFSKVNLYANSRLPPNLPPFNIPLSFYPMICLAAKYSHSVYQRPTATERETHIEADWRMGTKAMIMKSMSVDNKNTIIFTIRGTHNFMDWAVNVNCKPVTAEHFLDDPGNLCHSGFLTVARRMIRPVAARLRSLLEENPARSSFSLILTGHSAGGAVASLLFAHMLAEGVSSELNVLKTCFRRIHCFTFGAPPVSLLPLRKSNQQAYQGCAFLSFVNEGDPVPRADREYIRSLIDLYCSSPPDSPSAAALMLPSRFRFFRSKKTTTDNLPYMPIHIWEPPAGTLSNAGRLVVLRGSSGDPEDIRACATNDQQLRTVMFGDPMMHMMRIYVDRLESLATRAATGRMWA